MRSVMIGPGRIGANVAERSRERDDHASRMLSAMCEAFGCDCEGR